MSSLLRAVFLSLLVSMSGAAATSMPAPIGMSLLAATPSAPQENLLANGGFEKGGSAPVVGWQQIYPPGIQKPAPSFIRLEGGKGPLAAKEGKAFGRIQTNKSGGFSSFTQRGGLDNKQNLLKLSAWAKVEEVAPGSAVYLLVLFIDGDGKQIGMEQSKRLASAGDWELLEKEIVVPEGAEEWMLRCGIMGKASACFDDVQLIPSKLKGDVIPVQLAVHHGDYVIRSSGSKKEAWVSLSIPFPFAKQMPLAIRVSSEPAGMVKELRVLEDRENRPLRVMLNRLSWRTPKNCRRMSSST